MNEVINELIRIFENIKDELEGVGWYPADAYSTRWWGGAETPDEVVITAILVQQTRWDVVHEVLNRLRRLGLNTLENIANADPNYLAEAIKGVNYRFTKAQRLVKLARNIMAIGGLGRLRLRGNVRDFLLNQEGVGRETADSIMLFALNIPTLPISQYTRRVLGRVLGINPGNDYDSWKRILEELIPRDLYTYKLVHASVVTIGKRYCLIDNPLCGKCPLRSACLYARSRK
ncbi:endonuclease III domain-containing protein [Vulcanisaeta sp. JCM 16161]|uniref:endonuclease III domain-containing protein n=1 Tax=Vulcanisaeta sp. JCM 16161 TaxID=1295372 RepID=UPI0006CFAE8B|nr:DNA repair protein [Vulcanisaeta sp. JCM 16161]